ncbi:MAG: hypothetical protein ABSA85_08205 [Terracidiphilus sp.]|jgi:hypothetical protein
MSIFARRTLVAGLAIAFLFGCNGVAQEVPAGVHYKKASPELNAKAKAALQQALIDPANAKGFFSSVVACGPILWNDLKDSQEALSKDSTPMTMFLSVPEPLQATGRGFRTHEQRDAFWKTVTAKYPSLRWGVIRPAHANEILFFWAEIPIDIEEPFFAIETSDGVFVANLTNNNGTISLFWLDRVDDFRKLKK